MDINDLRSFVTVFAFLIFIGIVWWAWSAGSQRSFAEAALLPLEDDPLPRPAAAQETRKGNA